MEFDPTRHDAQKDFCIPEFHLHAVKNEHRSQIEGRPIFDEREYVRIIVPGGTLATTVVDRAVKAEDAERWPRQYAAFKAGLEQTLEGTPIREWAAITRSQAEELASVNVRTVEQLAALDDSTLKKCAPMGGYDLRSKAQAFLRQAGEMAPFSALQAENAQLKAQAEVDRQALADLTARLASLEAKQLERAA